MITFYHLTVVQDLEIQTHFAQQYLPEIYEQEVERYGNRTLSGFLRMVGAEMPMTSDQVIWSEQNRLHVAYNDVSNDCNKHSYFHCWWTGDSFVENVISKNQTIVILDPAGLELKALVTNLLNLVLQLLLK